jgi:hypothetical protein
LFNNKYSSNHIGNTSSNIRTSCTALATMPRYIVVHPGYASSEITTYTFGGRGNVGASVDGGNDNGPDKSIC